MALCLIKSIISILKIKKLDTDRLRRAQGWAYPQAVWVQELSSLKHFIISK